MSPQRVTRGHSWRSAGRTFCSCGALADFTLPVSIREQWHAHVASLPAQGTEQSASDERLVCSCPKPGPCFGTGGLGKQFRCADTQSPAVPAEGQGSLEQECRKVAVSALYEMSTEDGETPEEAL